MSRSMPEPTASPSVPGDDGAIVVEAVSARARETRVVEHLIAAARGAIGAAIVARVSPDRQLAVLTLDPAMEGLLHESLRDVDGVLHLVVDPQRLGVLVEGVQRGMGDDARGERPVAIVCGQLLRRPLQRTLDGIGVQVPVLAYSEIPPTVDLLPIGVIGNVPIDA